MSTVQLLIIILVIVLIGGGFNIRGGPGYGLGPIGTTVPGIVLLVLLVLLVTGRL